MTLITKYSLNLITKLMRSNLYFYLEMHQVVT